jgi:hypothetical protein
MAKDVNWWLMALAFVLGLALTFALMIRRVKREVPAAHAVSTGTSAMGSKSPEPTVRGSRVSVPDVDVPKMGLIGPDGDIPDGDVKRSGHGLDTGAGAAGAAVAGAVAGSAATAKFGGKSGSESETATLAAAGEEPYGPGSKRAVAGDGAPSGYTIKGDEDSKSYCTPEGPSYEQTNPTVWFRDEDSAVRSGFTRWDKGIPLGVAGAAAATGAAASMAKFADEPTGKAPAAKEEPYGPGSTRVVAGGGASSGYTIKGNEDSMLYHTAESPSYRQTVAEVWFRDEESAVRAGFTRWDKSRVSAGPSRFGDIPPGPFGPGSAKPNADGSGPSGWTVKGNEDSMLYHTPESPSYRQTVAEVWFRDEESAVRAGFGPWHKGRKR